MSLFMCIRFNINKFIENTVYLLFRNSYDFIFIIFV